MPSSSSPDLKVFEAAVQSALDRSTISVLSARKLSGGAIQENWWLVIEQDGKQDHLILRCDAAASLSLSHSRQTEYMILTAAYEGGVKVPLPLALAAAENPLQRPFFLMQALKGEALGSKVVRDPKYQHVRQSLAGDLGRELAKIHALPLRDELAALFGAAPSAPAPSAPVPSDLVPLDPARERVQTYYDMLDGIERPSPVIEFALRWLSNKAPQPDEVTFIHGDFRTGNYMINESGLVAILDWEFCGLSDPHEDLAWFLSADWRFGRDDLEAGGIGSRESFLTAYRVASGRFLDPERLHYWSIMAAVRWAIITLKQGERLTKGAERRLEPALISRRVFPTERQLLKTLAPLFAKDSL